MHIARWLFLETKEDDFGCQFVLTLCKVCLEAEEAIYRPESGVHCSGCSDVTDGRLMLVHAPKVMGSQLLVLFVSDSPAHGAAGWEKRSLE